MSLWKFPSLLMLAFALLGNTAWGATPEEPAPGIKIIHSDFGLFNRSDSGEFVFVPTRTVPLVPGQAYGWAIELSTDRPEIKLTEDVILPAKPATWGNEEPGSKRVITPDQRIAITRQTVKPENGIISSIWSVAPGDPAGSYIIHVYVEDTLVAIYDFEVQPE